MHAEIVSIGTEYAPIQVSPQEQVVVYEACSSELKTSRQANACTLAIGPTNWGHPVILEPPASSK